MLQGGGGSTANWRPYRASRENACYYECPQVVFTNGEVCIFTVAFRGRDLVLVLAAGFVQLLGVV